eukprot:TRINITY_DN4326_c1_g1_i2.p2 TRINITY_DN4326_c1_g1~~TRINITY_DN4326_c1_g1_i2.p2  ORF type:complete len:201 (-),score=26.51 TRINITY_DN4326_c1_g1_i2:70-672(-)
MIASYGSCTATLEHSPGTLVEVFVTFLTPKLLQRMHETEGAYFLMEIDEVDLQLGTSIYDIQHEDIQNGFGRHLEIVYQYNHQNGTLHMPFSPKNGINNVSAVSLSAIPAIDRKFPELSQLQMQYALMNWLENDQLLDSKIVEKVDLFPDQVKNWIDGNLEDSEKRKELVLKLHKFAKPFDAPNFQIAMQLGDMFSDNVK